LLTNNHQSTIWKNSIFVFFTQAIRLVTNFLIFILIARFYGPEALGQFSLAFTIANISLVLADFGFDVLLQTEIAKNRKKAAEIISNYFSIKIIFVLFASIVMVTIPSFQSFSATSASLIYLLVLYVIFTSISNFIYAIFRGFEKFEFETRVSFIVNSLLLVLLLTFGFLKSSLHLLILIFIIVRLIGVILNISKSNSLVGTNIFKINFNNWKLIINQVLIFGLHFLFGNLYFKIDTILIGIWKGDVAVGIYQAAFKLLVLLLILPDIVSSSILPVTSRLFHSDKLKWEELNRLISKILLLISFILFFILFFLSDSIISIIYGKEYYNEAIHLLKIFSFIVVIRYYVETYGLMLTTSGRQYIRMMIVIGATILAYILNFYLIGKFDIRGAAYASLIVNIIVGICYIFPNRKYFVKWFFEKRIIIISLFTVLTAFLLKYFIFINWLILLFIGIFFVIIYLVGLSNNEKEKFSNLIYKNI